MKVEARHARNMGLGVFALKNIKEGEIIERCPVIQIPAVQYNIIKYSIFNEYIYEASDRGGETAKLCLGLGSLYNHSDAPNTGYYGVNARYMEFYAVRNIKKGEQLFIDYGEEYWTGRGYE